MISNDLSIQWSEITNKYSKDTAFSDTIFKDLIKQYTSKSRHYHDLGHIENMLSSMVLYRSMISDYDSVFFAVWFHDVVYESLNSANEEKSADYAKHALAKLNYPENKIEIVIQLILATKNHTNIKPDEDLDTQLLLDADLKVLGADPEQYILYAKAVRKEYKLVPDLLYKPGRKKVLTKFLEMPFLYRTKEFQNLYEEKARTNLAKEISEL
jgi:predicted metal-dependent HD superfamily phosphohydrolase